MTLLDILFPKRCVGCGKLGSYFCASCVSTIRPIEPAEAICPMCEKPAIDGITHPRCVTRYSLDGLTSFFHYDGVVRKAIKTLKYRFVSDLASEFIGLIPEDPISSLPKLLITQPLSAFLVPIPLHPSRFRDRGFNQAEKLGRLLANRLHIPIRIDMLRRTKRAEPQVIMRNRKERLQNMNNAFSLNNLTIQQFNNIVLFDDVFTTGATMRAAANTLKRAGIKRVWAVTMAR